MFYMEQQALHQALYQALVRSGLAVPSRSGKGQFEIVAGEMDCHRISKPARLVKFLI